MTFAPINAPAPVGPKYSFIAAVPAAPNDGAKWTAGLSFKPEPCAPGAVGGITCLSTLPAMNTGGTDGPSLVHDDPFIVWAADQCSAMASTTYDFEGRARRALDTSESYWLAHELATGSLAINGRRFQDGSAHTVTGAAVAPNLVAGLLDQYLGTTGRGRRGILHVTPSILAGMVAGQTLEHAGGIWLTPMGNIVSADAGYTGASPAGVAPTTSQWAYVTSMMYLRLGQVQSLTDELYQQIDLSVNTRRYVAWRPALIEWDECVLGAAQVALAVPA